MKAGTLTTRILIATGTSEPTELATITTDIKSTRNSEGATLSLGHWQRALALGLLRAAWTTLTARPQATTPLPTP